MKKRTMLTLSLVLSVLLQGNAHAVPLGTIDSGEYPYVGFTAMGWSYASGILIAPDVVLTAAHVAEQFSPTDSNIFVTGNDVLAAERFVGIASSVVHPSYDPLASIFDFGLLFLDEPIALTEYATLLPSTPASLLGVDAEVVGYGGAAMRRRVGNVSVDDVQDSWLISNPIGGLAVVESGDSGGGLFVNIDGQNVLAGISSFVFPGGPSFFGSVGQANSFIDQYVPDARWYGESVVTEPPPVSVPEPGTLGMFALGLFVIAARRFWIKRPMPKV